MTYSSLEQYRAALASWQQEALAFQTAENNRLAALEEYVKHCHRSQPLLGMLCVAAFISVAVLIAGGQALGALLLAVLELYLLVRAVEGFRRLERWHLRSELVRREYDAPRPAYSEPSSPPPPRNEQRSQSSPPPRAEVPPRPEPPKNSEFAKITSLGQAFEILGLPPGRVTLSQARAVYRKKVAKCHPDKCMHLDEELRARWRHANRSSSTSLFNSSKTTSTPNDSAAKTLKKQAYDHYVRA